VDEDVTFAVSNRHKCTHTCKHRLAHTSKLHFTSLVAVVCYCCCI